MAQSTGVGSRGRVASVDWVALREAFITRAERPLIEDLVREFGASEARIRRAMHDEGWPAMRAARLDEALRSSDAVKALLDAARTEGTVQRAVSNLALEVIGQLHEVSAQAGKGANAANTRANTLNTVTFALRNLAGALKDVGLIGLPRALKSQAGMADEQGRWNAGMLQSLNLTVQNIVSAPAPAAAAAPSGPIPGPSDAEGVSGDPLPLAAPAGAVLDLPPVEAPEPVPAEREDVI